MLERPPNSNLCGILVPLLRKPLEDRVVESAHDEWGIRLDNNAFLVAILHYLSLLAERV